MRGSRNPIQQQTALLTADVPTVVGGLLGSIPRPQKMGTPGIVLMMGFPGVGKSHCARLIARQIGAVHVASDELRGQLFVAASYGERENAAVFRILEGLVEQILDEGYRVVVDATHLRKSGRASTLAVAHRRGVPLSLVLVVAEDSETRQRLQERSRARAANDKSEADERVYDTMRSRGFEEPDVPYLTLRNGAGLDGEIERVARDLEAQWAAAS